MKKATIQLGTLTCPSCVLKIENAVKSMNGINKETVNVMFNASKVKFEVDTEKLNVEDVEKAIRTLGYEVINSKIK